MKPVVKGLLIGCSILLAALLILAGVLIWFAASKKDELIASGNKIRAEGTAFGKNVAEPRCVDEALERYRKDKGMVSGIQNAIFLGGCLEASAFDPDFCAGVPSEDEFTRTITWRVEQCRNRGFAGDSTCPNIFSEVQRYCHGPARAKKKQ
jgi:hypothetical protein